MIRGDQHLATAGLALALSAVLLPVKADASAFQLRQAGAQTSARAFAGTVAAEGDTTAVANNPALLSRFEQASIQTDVLVVDLSATFDGGGSAAANTPLEQPLTGGNGGDAGTTKPLPTLSAVFPISERIALGVELNSPFGLVTDYDSAWVGRYEALKSDFRTKDLTVSAGVKLNDALSVGAGVIVEQAEATLTTNVDFGSAICATAQRLCSPTMFYPQRNDGRSWVNGDSTNLGWVVGIYWKPTDRFGIGYSHRSSIAHTLKGAGSFDLPQNVSTVLGLVAPGQFIDSAASARLELPSIDSLGLAFQANDRLSLAAEYQRVGWSSMKELRVHFDNPKQADSAVAYNWSDSWSLSLGADYRLDEHWVLHAGVLRDNTPVSDAHRTPRAPDVDRDWFTFGLTYAAHTGLRLTLGYAYVRAAEDPPIDHLSASGSTLNGTYDAKIQLLMLGVQGRF